MFPSKKQIQYAEKISKTLGLDMPDTTDLRSVNEFINTYKKAFYEKTDREIYEKIAREIQITDYAQELGYTLVRKGRYYSLKEHDSVMIDPDKNYFWRNSQPGTGHSIGYGDTVIGFAQMFSGKTMKEIITDFSGRISEDATQRTYHPRPNELQREDNKNVELELPPKNENMKRVYAYLIKSRYIDQDIVQYFVDNQLLYQDTKGNCVFVGYDDKNTPVYTLQRGTDTRHRFVRDCIGCNYDYGMYINHGSNTLIVHEAAIDCMSLMSVLSAKGYNIQDYNYLIMSGNCKIESISSHIQKDHIKHLIIAVDNDLGGEKSIAAIRSMIKEKELSIEISECLPEKKDWNEEIKSAFQNGVRYKNIQLSHFPEQAELSAKTNQGAYTKKYYNRMMDKNRSCAFINKAQNIEL